MFDLAQFQWFEGKDLDTDDPDYQNKLRFVADYAFRKARYEVALDKYQTCLGKVTCVCIFYFNIEKCDHL